MKKIGSECSRFLARKGNKKALPDFFLELEAVTAQKISIKKSYEKFSEQNNPKAKSS